MGWKLLRYRDNRPTKEALRSVEGKASFYADHNLDESIVHVLRHFKYDVQTSRDIGAQAQPDDYQFRHASKSKRVLLTQDKDFLDNRRFPLSETKGVIVFNVDTADIGELSRAVQVVRSILGGLAPVMKQAKAVVNSDFTLTMIQRLAFDGGFVEERTRYRLHENGEDIYIWEDE